MLKKRLVYLTVLLSLNSMLSFSQTGIGNTTIREVEMELLTYSYSNPREYVDAGRMYPYHRFDGYSAKGKMQKWKMVEMENEYIKVWILPAIGGKVWGAVDKQTGEEFLYFNHVVKFRDVSSRGPWTSGGMEMNFGIIGHSPWCSSQVDYVLETLKDGSVSCTVGGLDISLGTDWRVQVILPTDKAYMETKVLWSNNTAWEKPMYQWMNAGIKTAGDLHYYYPGNQYLTHPGESMSWPSEQGHRIDRYDENDFGHYKSYHVTGNITDFWGAYWNDDQFGMAHVSPYQDKLGKKIWIWGLSRYGMVWEDLLTDKDGQYTEVQSGKLFNQSVGTSFKTPFKHLSFEAGHTYKWTEFWMPIQRIGGIDFCSTDLAYYWSDTNKEKTLNIYAVSPLNSEFKIVSDGEIILSKKLKMTPTQTEIIELNKAINKSNYSVYLCGELLYDSALNGDDLTRPTASPEKFDYESAYGLYIQGKEFEKQNFADIATSFYKKSLSKGEFYVPTLVSLAGIYFQQNRFDDADKLVRIALSVDTYDAKANLLFGQISKVKGNLADAVDAYSVAMQTPALTGASSQSLAELYVSKGAYKKALNIVEQSLQENSINTGLMQLHITLLRLTRNSKEAVNSIEKLLTLDPLNYVAHFERYLITKSEKDWSTIKNMIVNEYWNETYLSLALYYENKSLNNVALELLAKAPIHPRLLYQRAYLLHKMGEEKEALETLEEAESMSPSLIFPNKATDEELFKWVKETGKSSWKANYYLALLYLYFDRYDESEQLFNACGNTSDFYAFYIARAMNMTKDESDFLKAIELAPERFVCYFEAAKFYMANDQGVKAVKVLEKYRKQDKENSYVNLLLAKAYLQARQYSKGVDLMKSILVLPNEGSLDGRNVWRESNLSYAIALIEQGKYKKALPVIADARMWPENLGVGKPYDDSNDERLEDLLEWYVYDKMGKHRADLRESIKTKSMNMQPNAISNLFALLLMDKNQVDAYMQKWDKLFGEEQAYHLSKAVLNNNWQEADKVINRKYPRKIALPFEVLFDDRDLVLIIDNYTFFMGVLTKF